MTLGQSTVLSGMLSSKGLYQIRLLFLPFFLEFQKYSNTFTYALFLRACVTYPYFLYKCVFSSVCVSRTLISYMSRAPKGTGHMWLQGPVCLFPRSTRKWFGTRFTPPVLRINCNLISLRVLVCPHRVIPAVQRLQILSNLYENR